MTIHAYQHPGACACGAVRVLYHSHKPLQELRARACQCDYCRPTGAAYLSGTDSELHIKLKDSRYLYAHRFGTASADFMHCAVCNTQVFVRCEWEGRLYALVSVGVLEERAALAGFDEVDYEGESLDQRLQRRAQHWVPTLKIHTENDQ